MKKTIERIVKGGVKKTLDLFKLNLERRFLLMEFVENKSLGFSQFFKTAQKGFLSISPILYNFKENDSRDYISDWTRLKRTSKINGKRAIVLNDKFLFHLMNKKNPYVPPMVGVKRSKKLYNLNEDYEHFQEIDTENKLVEFVKQYEGGLIVKPQGWGGGLGITKINVENKELIFKGDCRNWDDFQRNIIQNHQEFLVMPFIKQTGEIGEIYPETLNSIRILTMIDPETETPFIVNGVLRLGTKKSGIVDNWMAGGISAKVERETGKIGLGAIYNQQDHKLEWLKEHPNTGKEFYKKTVPHWEEITAYALKLSQQYAYIPYIGWDFVPMADGFLVLEGNTNSGLQSLQTHHGGLLKDQQVKKFYRHHGVLKN